jgi:hypothetical protein
MTNDPRDRAFADLAEGEALRPLHVSVTREHINGYQDFLGHHDPNTIEGTQWLVGNNLHVDEDFSRRNMYGGVVGDGNQTIQYLCQLLTDYLPWGSLVSGYSSLDVKLTNPTRPGDEVVATGAIVRKLTENGRDYVICEVQASKQQDALVALGTFKVHVPRLTPHAG